jgi:hypothetical protein
MAKYSKFIAAASGFIGVLVANGFLSASDANLANAVIAAVAAVAVFVVKNTPKTA